MARVVTDRTILGLNTRMGKIAGWKRVLAELKGISNPYILILEDGSKGARQMRTKQTMLVTLGCLLLWTATAAVASEHMHSMKAGKKGEITLTKATKVGDKVLQPDTYVVQHRTSGGDHFVRFLELKKGVPDSFEGQYTYTQENNAGEIKCHVEPTASPVTETMVSMAGDRITKVAIKGEDVVHLF